ncbi:MAG: hypothetical protein K2I10_12385, partial [Lachnospiraceae bacterium]|nr:hypothetical protein [Lachnospiraceae bacterium]
MNYPLMLQNLKKWVLKYNIPYLKNLRMQRHLQLNQLKIISKITVQLQKSVPQGEGLLTNIRFYKNIIYLSDKDRWYFLCV